MTPSDIPTSALKGSCRTALKEWAAVLEAMGEGRQILLLRKGGLLDPQDAFRETKEPFLFFPSYTHQAMGFLRTPYQRYMEQARQRHPEDAAAVYLDWVGKVERITPLPDDATFETLEPFHIYNRAFLNQRLQWQPQAPIVLMVIRFFRLSPSICLPFTSAYAGCRSWIDLGKSINVEQARPVLNEAAWRERLKALDAVLNRA